MNTKRAESSHDRCRFGHPRKDVRPDPAEGLFSYFPSVFLSRCACLPPAGQALPAHPQCDGLSYPHAHAPRRRLRPSDLTRELTFPSRLMAKHWRLKAFRPPLTPAFPILAHHVFNYLYCLSLAGNGGGGSLPGYRPGR